MLEHKCFSSLVFAEGNVLDMHSKTTRIGITDSINIEKAVLIASLTDSYKT